MFRAVFFDFGGVILSSPFEAFASYEVRAGLPDSAIRTVNSHRPDDNAWARLERGAISVEDFIGLFEAEARSLGYTLDAREVLRCLKGEVRTTMLDAVRRCSESLRTVLVTNNVAPLADGTDASGLAGVLACFDIVVESSSLGVRKPERRFYEIACEMADVDPSEVVFLDDLGVNLKAAREMGMTTIKVVDPADALRELEDVTGLMLGAHR